MSSLGGCSLSEPTLTFDSVDLVVEGEWRVEDHSSAENEGSAGNESSAAAPIPKEILCHDEGFLALPLEPGTRVSTRVTLDDGAVLQLGGCSDPSQGAAAGARLEVVVETAGSEPLRRQIPLAKTGEPWRESVDLGALAGRPSTLRLRAEGLDRTVWMRTLRLTSVAPGPRKSLWRKPPRSQVLFISVDTLREDGLREDGLQQEGLRQDGRRQDGQEAPDGAAARSGFDRFLADSQVFSPHYASAGWTRPSHGTLLTGLSPYACNAVGTDSVLYPGLRTVAERFQDAGFRTGALFYDIEWLHPRYGFGRGFETYRMERWRLDRSAPEVVRWISEHRDEPFFFFFHTFEPHSDGRVLPYESEGTTRRTVGERFGVPGYGCRSGLCASSLLIALDRGEVEPLPREPEILHFLYGRSAGFVRRQLGALFDELRRLGLYDHLLIVVTSDHGEVLLEHGQLLHGKWWEEVIRVPLAIKWPGGELAGTHERRRTGSEDLAPTVLEAAGLDASDLPGASLRGRRRARPVFTGHNFRAVIAEGLKAVFQGEVTLLFDLDEDPQESRDLAGERPEDVERLRALVEAKEEFDRVLARRFDRPSDGEVPEMSEEARQRLRALGYLGDSEKGEPDSP